MNADQPLDFTTMDDTAAYTAAAALDDAAPEILRVAGDQTTPRQLAALGTELFGRPFELVRAGGLDDLARLIMADRAAHPDSESEEFPSWQRLQYTHNMASGVTKLTPVENQRYPEIEPTTLRQFLSRMRR